MPSDEWTSTPRVSESALDFEDAFDAGSLDSGRWVAHYLPHWTTPDRSAARFDLTTDGLVLQIDVDQPAWRVEDGEMRVSNIQSGAWSGPLDSTRGQHRHRPDLTVRSPQRTHRLYTPTTGRIDATMRAVADPTTMLAFWLIGFEDDSADDCGEICVVELFGDVIGPAQSTINVGLKAHHDPRLHDDMARISLPMDASEWHTYSVDWRADRIDFFVDDRRIHQVAQTIGYPMQLMLDLFEFPPAGPRVPSTYPKTGYVRSVRAHVG